MRRCIVPGPAGCSLIKAAPFKTDLRQILTAICAAVVTIETVAVITSLRWYLKDSIATVRSEFRTIPSTAIVIVCIAIVAGFVALGARRHILAVKTVATASGAAVLNASIEIIIIPVVTSFKACLTGVDSSPKVTVATAGISAIIEASVRVVIIPVIASFITALADGSVQPQQAIATPRHVASAGTTVLFIIIAIVTTLKAGLALDEIRANELVATCCPTTTDAGILADLITIIADLPLGHNAITTAAKGA